MADLKLGTTAGGYLVIHTNNFNSYAPKLDGTGATGTWGINISGDANTLDGQHGSYYATAGQINAGALTNNTLLKWNGTNLVNSAMYEIGGVSYWGANAATPQGGLTWDTGYATVFATAGNELRFGSNGSSPKMVLDQTGQLGIARNVPTAKISVLGNANIGSNPNQSVWMDSTGGPDYGSQIYLTNDLGSTQGAVRIRSLYTGAGTSQYPNLEISRSTTAQAYGYNPNTLTYVSSLVIDGNNGFLGVGVTSPMQKIHTDGVIRAGVYYSSDDRDFIELIPNGTDTKVRSVNERFHIVNEAGSLLLQYLQSGNVGIKTNAPSETLSLIGNIAFGTTEGKAKMTYNSTENSIDFIIN